MEQTVPTYDVDLYSDEVHTDPHPHYRRLRDLGAAVWIPKNQVWAIPRYQDVKDCLRNTEVFVSGHGVAIADELNVAMRGTLLCSDGDLHNKLRRIIGGPMLPGALAALTERVQAEADALVERLVARGSFDAVPDLAFHLPLTLVTQFVGLSEEGREHMLTWAAAGFDALGPANARQTAGIAKVGEMAGYIQKCVGTRAVAPGSWGDKIFQAVDRGEITLEQGGSLLMDYIFPSLDTTINGTSAAIWCFARWPDQWEAVRRDPNLIPNAINEAVRLESPIRGFTRYVQQDHEIDGIRLQAGSRAVMLYASANRDERKWERPETFDVTRKVADHLGFGHGVHQCAGMHLARLEISCLLKALIPLVERFDLAGEPRHGVNNVLRGLASLPVRVH